MIFRVELKAILKPTFSKKQNILETFDFYSIQMYHLCKSISQEVFFADLNFCETCGEFVCFVVSKLVSNGQ